ncbi:MAG: MlaA family lipoprotein [Burkholderiales bacterium]
MKRLILIAAVLSGCATSGNPQDPLEPLNRGVYKFNDALDKAIVKPVAQGYDAVAPQPVQTGVANFFSNLGDVIVVLNDFLQLKIAQGVSDAGRLMINSTIGILGFIDVGSDIGLPKHNEDFGQTLGYWGTGTGAYIVLPFFGPSNVRDTAGLVVDIVSYPVYYVNDSTVRIALYGTDTVSDRDQLLQAEKVLDAAALDQYQFVRDSYMQRRRNLVHDGSPPKEDFEEEEPEGEPAPKPSAPSLEEKDPKLNNPGSQTFPDAQRRRATVWLPRIPKNFE